jgi:hypothetical protein
VIQSTSLPANNLVERIASVVKSLETRTQKYLSSDSILVGKGVNGLDFRIFTGRNVLCSK